MTILPFTAKYEKLIFESHELAEKMVRYKGYAL